MNDQIAERRRAFMPATLMADTASLGPHGLYDRDRLRAIAPDRDITIEQTPRRSG